MSASTTWKEALLSFGFIGDIVIPSDPDYNTALVRFAKNTQRNAGLVAFVRSAEDVSLVIKYATVNKVPIVIRGGGHSSTSSTNGGIVIDLSRHLTNVRIDEGKKLAYVAGGATWATVDSATIQHGLATVTGTVNHTGVGGVTLGGGYGWLTGEHGLVIDNLVQGTVVTADGSILTANEVENSDLFWGIRGGGSNFGCVTEFVFQLHPQRKNVFSGALSFLPSRIAEVMSVIQDLQATTSEKEGVSVFMTSRSTFGGPAFVVLLFFNGNETGGRQRFQKLFDLEPVVDFAGMMPFERLNTLHNVNLTYGENYHLSKFTRSYSVTAEVVAKAFDKMMEIANAPGMEMQMAAIWDYYSMDKMSSISPYATAFEMRVPHGLTILWVHWTGDSEEFRVEAKKRLKAIKMFCDKEIEVESRGMTASDAGDGNRGTEMGSHLNEDAANIAYGSNYPRLQQLKRKYDPNMVFNSWNAIRPAV